MPPPSQWPTYRPDLFHDPKDILEEIEVRIDGLLGPVLHEGLAWNGICVFHEKSNEWDKHEFKLSLENLPKLKEFINKYFDIDRIRMINIYNLEPGARLHPHRDMEGNLILGMIRVHYCLQTNISCTLLNEHLEEGRFMSFSTSELHSAKNLGETNRFHLVLDLKSSEKHKIYFPKLSLKILLRLLDRSIRIFALLVRDLFKRPSSLISRINSLIKK